MEKGSNIDMVKRWILFVIILYATSFSKDRHFDTVYIYKQPVSTAPYRIAVFDSGSYEFKVYPVDSLNSLTGGYDSISGTENYHTKFKAGGHSIGDAISHDDGSLMTIEGNSTVTGIFSSDSTINWTDGNVIYVPIDADIQTYIDSASAGYTLILASGQYVITDTLLVDKQLNIIGYGHAGFLTTPVTSGHGTLVSSTTADVVCFHITSDNVRIADMSINMTGDNSTGIITDNNLVGIVFNNIDLIINCAGAAQGFVVYGSDAVFRDLSFYITSSTGAANGVLFYNDNATTQDAIVDCWNVTGTSVGGAAHAYSFACYNDNDANTVTLNLSNSVCKALEGTPLDIAVVSYSTATNNAVVNAYMCNFDGADYDAFQSGSNEMNLGGSILENKKVAGTVTYRATMASGNIVVGDTIYNTALGTAGGGFVKATDITGEFTVDSAPTLNASQINYLSDSIYTLLSGLTSGYMPYFNGTDLANTGLYYDGVGYGIGTVTPVSPLNIVAAGGANTLGQLQIEAVTSANTGFYFKANYSNAISIMDAKTSTKTCQVILRDQDNTSNFSRFGLGRGTGSQVVTGMTQNDFGIGCQTQGKDIFIGTNISGTCDPRILVSGANNGVGIGTITPLVVASYTYGASTHVVNISDISNPTRFSIQGNSAQINLVDLGGDIHDKWASLSCDNGIVKFRSLHDTGVVRKDNIFVLDMGTGDATFGYNDTILGNVYIQNSSPSLNLTDTDGGKAIIYNNNGNIYLQADTGNTEATSGIYISVDGQPPMAKFDQNQRFGLGTNSPDEKAHVVGNIKATGTIYADSIYGVHIGTHAAVACSLKDGATLRATGTAYIRQVGNMFFVTIPELSGSVTSGSETTIVFATGTLPNPPGVIIPNWPAWVNVTGDDDYLKCLTYGGTSTLKLYEDPSGNDMGNNSIKLYAISVSWSTN